MAGRLMKYSEENKMNENEWIKKAEEYERMAQKAYDEGDEIAGEFWDRQARLCRFVACFAPVESGGV